MLVVLAWWHLYQQEAIGHMDTAASQRQGPVSFCVYGGGWLQVAQRGWPRVAGSVGNWRLSHGKQQRDSPKEVFEVPHEKDFSSSWWELEPKKCSLCW